MKQKPLSDIRYRIYIADGVTNFYLHDIIVYEHTEHYFFDADRRYAMFFRKWDTAMNYRERMIRAGYHPHIESF